MSKRFEALDAFRGLCALSVVIFHMHFVGSVTELDFFRGSAILVEFFFVLSGFVLAHSYAFRENLNFYSFMRSRFFRLFPLHIFMLIFFLSLQFAKLLAYKSGITFETAPFTGNYAASEILPNLLLIQSWLPFTEHASFNGPSWSISIEFYLYVFLFITIFFTHKRKVFVWFIISIISFLAIYYEYQIFHNMKFILKGLSCFFGGSIAYILFKKISHYKPTFLLGSFLEVTLISIGIYLVQSNVENRAIVCSLVFIITIICFAFESGLVSKLLKLSPFQLIGKLSYSIYMVHAGIIYCITIVAILIGKFTGFNAIIKTDGLSYNHLTFGNDIVNNTIVILTLLLVLLVSKITYRYVEVPGQLLNARIPSFRKPIKLNKY